MIDPALESFVKASTGASRVKFAGVVQELWSGYGKILRLNLVGAEQTSVIAKHIAAPTQRSHPRGWVTDLSHERKVKSYEVELAWYRNWSSRCREGSRLPRFLAAEQNGDDVFLLLEDLNASGFPKRLTTLTIPQLESCLAWLAEFHATFFGEKPAGLWETGTYWHLATRPDEFKALTDPELKQAAVAIDRRLSAATYQTFVHGDAKLANFCFSADCTEVAALDFQYVGRGCGMKDVAYFIGSCLDEEACELKEGALLDSYFQSLRDSLTKHQPKINPAAVEAEWRELFPVAWTDFHRFLKGWCPGHWKINGYSERIAREVISQL
ncbi:MAG: phosphotransferase [Verrucomicrobiales bacterium]|nr:phosphotransferase [Verrucomicrobiales bacterium]